MLFGIEDATVWTAECGTAMSPGRCSASYHPRFQATANVMCVELSARGMPLAYYTTLVNNRTRPGTKARHPYMEASTSPEVDTNSPASSHPRPASSPRPQNPPWPTPPLTTPKLRESDAPTSRRGPQPRGRWDEERWACAQKETISFERTVWK